MKRTLVIFGCVLALAGSAVATSYYVSSSSGNDTNDGISAATAWATLGAHVNGGSFNPGDVIYLKRGDTWNEQLIPPSPGAAGNPIQFDAYGTGAAPVITAAAPVPFVNGTWIYVSGSTWKATMSTAITAPTVNMVLFGSVYGRKQPYGSGCASSIVNKYDWCLAWPTLYVYSPPGVDPLTTYSDDGSIVPIIGTAAGLQMIYVNGTSWLTFQHIKVQTFDYVGVGVVGSSDNLVFANMESDGMVPYGTTPLGFYVNAATPTNVQFLNDEGMCTSKSGAEKKDAAMTFLQNALSMTDAIASREIVQPEQFRNGISQIIDGVVMCMNASAWAKSGISGSTGPAQ